MAGEPQATRWAQELGVQSAIELLPRLNRDEMATSFRRAQIAVSPTSHDGTPNTLLEAMACGCFPIAGDIASLREWITPGHNGLLVDPRSPPTIAEAILEAIDRQELRDRAREYNLALITARADYDKVMAAAESFYQTLTP
jgi:glycosyltransferase involved in cell wall biosynthesis